MGAGDEGRIFKIGDGIEGGLSDDGRRLPVYSIGDSVGRYSFREVSIEGRAFIGLSDDGRKSMIHQFGENVGRHFNCPAGGEGKSFVYVGSEVSDV
jgi:hypothetical protein